jgi:hypothetical protein
MWATGLASALIIGSLATAVEAVPLTYDQATASMDLHLKSIERRLDAIEKSSTVDVESDSLAIAMERHAAMALQAFHLALSDLRLFAESRGARGSTRKAQQFETLIRTQRDRADRVVERMATIDAHIRTGHIRLAPQLIRRLSPDQLQMFRRELTPHADSIYGSVNFDSAAPPATSRSFAATSREAVRSDPPEWGLESSGLPHGSWLDAILDVIVPRADASLGVACYYTCKFSAFTACISCVAGAGGFAYAAYQKLKSCRNWCCTCRWYKPWCCACRGACWTGFLATLA